MKYAVLNLLLGAGLISQGFLYRSAAIPLFWLGASFLILGMAYLAGRPGLLGKRADGTMAWWSRGLLFPLHLYIHSVWHLCRIFSREPAVCRVTPRLSVGRRLLASEIPSDVELIVDLTAEFPEPAGVREGRDYRLFPMLDATAPDADRLREFIASLPDAPTFIHCAQGHGRTGLFAMVFLVHRGVCASLPEAETLLTAARPGIRLNGEQRAFIAACELNALIHQPQGARRKQEGEGPEAIR
ncbi:MAG: tyrosine-protein phosphatase [Verrucomicrobiota bacterium]